MSLFLTLRALAKDKKAKENSEENYFHNISRPFDVLPNFLFIISKIKRLLAINIVYTNCLMSCR